MIYFLNRGLILESEIVKVAKEYLKSLDVTDYYKNNTIRVVNDHPFAKMYLSQTPEKESKSLLPVIVVSSESEVKPGELKNVVSAYDMDVVPEEIAPGKDGGPSVLERRYIMLTPKKMAEIRAAMDNRKEKRILGRTWFIRRQDVVSIDIWANNPQLKNELYDLMRNFICGFMRDYLEKLYESFYPELKNAGGSPFSLFDHTVVGHRGGNYNLDFGIPLYGGVLTFEADYIVEQSIIDTEIVETNDFLLEVSNHVKDIIPDIATREWIYGPADGDDGATDLDGDGGG